MTSLKVLAKASGCKPRKGEDRQEYMSRLVKAILDLPEDDWAGLPDEDQDWVNDSVLNIKAKKPIVDPEDDDEDEEEAPIKKAKKPAKRGKKAKPVEEEDDDEDEEEAPVKKTKKPGGGIVAGLRETYITAYLKSPKNVSTEKVLATLEKKGIIPGKGTINVQLATVKATLKSLNERGALNLK